jgi:hypothetical protein
METPPFNQPVFWTGAVSHGSGGQMRIFELQATFPASPPDGPDTLTYFVRSASLDEAKAKLKAFGGENIQLIRELSEEQVREFRYFS